MNVCNCRKMVLSVHRNWKFYLNLLFIDYSMINFIKPNFLGSKTNFAEDFHKPIRKGQHKDSSSSQVTEMVVKSFNLNEKMSKYIQVSKNLIYVQHVKCYTFPHKLFFEFSASRCVSVERISANKIWIWYIYFDDGYSGEFLTFRSNSFEFVDVPFHFII